MAQDRTSKIPTSNIGMAVDAMLKSYENQRKGFERRWYDNNFFDDGFHFRYVSRTTNRIVDLSDRQWSTMPQRALPKASRQIRGIANLLSQLNPTPVIYPEKLNMSSYDPQQYEQAKKESKDVAKKVGHWLTEEFKKLHLQEMITQMIILTGKHGISFVQIWPDAVDEKINAKVFDAFEIYLMGNLTSIYDSPSIIKATPKLISQIKANENYSEEAKAQLSPDNKYASSEIKQAYMQARYSTGMESDYATTVIEKEAFIKEYLNSENWSDISTKAGRTGAMEGKSKGDMIMRHTFTAGGVTLLDEYLDLPDYPFVDFRMEPGPIYQVPLIERFIPLNKSLDIIASRIERYANAMISGVWLKRRGEDFQINNMPGGQVIEYTTTPPVQANMSQVPPFMFQYMGFLENLIAEQGASTATTGDLPTGVKSGVAIESLKAAEYANLKIATDQLKDTTKRIAEKMMDIADDYFIKPQTVYMLEQGEPSYFDIIGQSSIEKRQQVGIETPNAIPIKKDYIVDIQIESGMGYTPEGKKATMQQIITFMIDMAKNGFLTQPAVMEVVKRFMEVFEFGATSEFMEAMDQGLATAPVNDQQMEQMKIAFASVVKDLGMAGPEHDQRLVDSTKVGVVEAMKDLADSGGGQQKEETTAKAPSESISFKDLPPEGQAQMAAQAGIQLSPQQIQANDMQKQQQQQQQMQQQAQLKVQTKSNATTKGEGKR